MIDKKCAGLSNVHHHKVFRFYFLFDKSIVFYRCPRAACSLVWLSSLQNDERSRGNLSPHRHQGETEPRVYHRGGQEHLHDHQHHQHYQQQQQQQHQALDTPPRHARQSLGPLSLLHRQDETGPPGHDEGGQQQQHQQQHQEQYLNQDQHPPSAPTQPATSPPLSSHRRHGETEPHAYLDDGQQQQQQQQQQRINQEEQPLPTPTRHARLSQLAPLSPHRGLGETEQQGYHEGGQPQQQQQQQHLLQQEEDHQQQEQEQGQQRQLNKEQKEKGGEEQEETDGKEEMDHTFAGHEQPAMAMLGEENVMEALKTAAENSVHATEAIKATMAQACAAVIQHQVRYNISLTVH